MAYVWNLLYAGFQLISPVPSWINFVNNGIQLQIIFLSFNLIPWLGEKWRRIMQGINFKTQSDEISGIMCSTKYKPSSIKNNEGIGTDW